MTQRIEHQFEFNFKARDELIYTYISTPYNLSSWFADNVEAVGDIFTFTWKGSSESAKVVKKIFKKKIIFQWIDREQEEYLTFTINMDEVTGGTMLLINDFDDEGQYDNNYQIWENTMQKLKQIIGG